MALLVIVAILPGLVAGFDYVSTSTSQALTSSSTQVTAMSCGWYYFVNDSSPAPYAGTTLGGANGTTGTVTFGLVDSAAYEYLVDEAAFGCTDIPSNSHIGIHIYQATSTEAVGAAGYYELFVSGGGGPIGEWTATGTLACAGTVVTGAPCSNYPNAPTKNPTTATSPCATAGGYKLYAPFDATSGASNSWAFNDNIATPAWDTTGCGQASGVPPQQNWTTGTPTAANIYFFYTISLAAIGLGASPSGSITLNGDTCVGGATTCTVV